MRNLLWKIIVPTSALLLTLTPALAAEVRLEASNATITVGDEVTIDVLVNSRESLNAVEGSLVFPDDALEVKDIREGNSIINFWIEKPRLTEAGKIPFSGIVPGGFNGVSSYLFSVVFRAKTISSAPITIQDIRVLLNDGSGTTAKTTVRNATLIIKAGDSSVHRETFKDTAPPEAFYPYVGQDEDLFNGKAFIVFSTQDKGSGISHYEVREGIWGWYTTQESPYVLKNQALDRDIFIKAIDNAGNTRLSITAATNPGRWYNSYAIRNITTLIVIISLIYLLWRRFMPAR